MNFNEYLERFSAELSTESFLVVTVLQILIVILVYYDMQTRNFSRLQRIVLIALVVVFPVPGALVYFLMVFSGAGRRETYECPVCETEFERKPDKCPVCGYITEEVEKQTKYVCTCGETFNTWIGWKDHVKKEHEGSKMAVNIDSEDYKCSKCGKSFETMRGLHIHQSKIHKED